jgi:hypothetical protein
LITQNATVTDATLLAKPVASPVQARPGVLGSVERCFTLVSFAWRL